MENELTNLCYREYPTFISVHNCSSAVTSAFDDFSSSLGRLLDAVPALEEECRTFARSTSGVQKARAKAALVQEQQDKLFDLLEIPQLMDTCVRNGYYQEALELSAHTDDLVKRYPNIELVLDVAKEVDGVLQLMLAQLLALLREPIKLPALVKTVGYLRRLSTIDEPELSLVFLISRLSNFKTHLVGLERDRADAVRYVRKYVDLFREHVFDIISQFTAIFLENSHSPVAASQLASFVQQCVTDLVDLISTFVPKMTNDTASLSSILVQIGYCSLAFARVGLDFAPMVTEPFSEAVLLAFSDPIDKATKSLTATIAQASKSVGSPSHVIIAHEYLSSLLSAESPIGYVKWDGSHEQLPTDLAQFPPLAILVNSHLTALNSLRLLAPLHLYPRLATAQSKALLACTHTLAQYVRQAVAVSETSSEPTRPGKAQLLRRNSETQLSPEARSARRREVQLVCVAFADAWTKVVCPLLADALDKGIFDSAVENAIPSRNDLREALDSLSAWVRDQAEHEQPAREINGRANGSGMEEKAKLDSSETAKLQGSLEEHPEADEAVDEPVEEAENEAVEEPVEVPLEEPMEELADPLSTGDFPTSPPVADTLNPLEANGESELAEAEPTSATNLQTEQPDLEPPAAILETPVEPDATEHSAPVNGTDEPDDPIVELSEAPPIDLPSAQSQPEDSVVPAQPETVAVDVGVPEPQLAPPAPPSPVPETPIPAESSIEVPAEIQTETSAEVVVPAAIPSESAEAGGTPDDDVDAGAEAEAEDSGVPTPTPEDDAGAEAEAEAEAAEVGGGAAKKKKKKKKAKK